MIEPPQLVNVLATTTAGFSGELFQGTNRKPPYMVLTFDSDEARGLKSFLQVQFGNSQGWELTQEGDTWTLHYGSLEAA